jgi:SAM-dependent methyltransferase
MPAKNIPLDKHGKIILDLGDSSYRPPKEIRNALLVEHWCSHPRHTFLKTLTKHAKLLDIGAANGGLYYWRTWCPPVRYDIDLYGIDINKDDFIKLYKDHQVVNIEDGKLKFKDDFFDAILMSHVMEHIQDTTNIQSEINRTLKKGGFIYIETPTSNTLDCVSLSDLKSHGILSSTFNFYDDSTHIRPWDIDDLEGLLSGMGIETIEKGIIGGSPNLAKKLLRYGILHQDAEITTYGLWRLTDWSAYVIGMKI